MTGDTDSAKQIKKDDDQLWLKGGGAEIVFSDVTDRDAKKRALDIVESVRQRFTRAPGRAKGRN